MNPDWLTPQWPAPPGVRALCTTRAGGASLPPYQSMNLGDHVGDAPPAVAQNRMLLRQAIQVQPVFLSQVHGVGVVALCADTLHGTVGDASITAAAGVACTIMVADCLPVLFTNRQGTVVGAAHAGWRGLLGQGHDRGHAQGEVTAGEPGFGVLEATYQSFRALAPVNITQPAIDNIATDILAWLGPCIGAQAFEVGDEVRRAFVAQRPAVQVHFKPHGPGKWLADLQGLARQRLQALGITQIYGNDGSAAWCTVSNPLRFFSHRRDAHGGLSTGRMAACIWRE